MIEFGIVPKGAVAWDSEPVRRRTERAYILGRGGALGLFAAPRRKVGVLSRERRVERKQNEPQRTAGFVFVSVWCTSRDSNPGPTD